MYEYLTF